MSLTRKGQGGWVMEKMGTLSTDRFGLSSATARWCRYDIGPSLPGQPAVFGSLHPMWTFLSCDKVSVTHNGVHWECDVNYFGIQGSPTPIYELDIRTSEEPIESHPDFKTFAYPAGTNGSRFDPTDGSFMGFMPQYSGTDVTNKAWVGVRGYLSPGAIWRKCYVSTTQPSDISQLGKIDSPEGSPPAIRDGANWLYAGLTWEQRGRVYTVKKEWQLSGRQGWNTAIYT